MHLPMAKRVQQRTIGQSIRTASHTIPYVVVVPTSFSCNCCLTHRTQTVLRAIKGHPLHSVTHAMQHALLPQLFAIQLIGRIVGIEASLDLFVSPDRRCTQTVQRHPDPSAIVFRHRGGKRPASSLEGRKIFLPYPCGVLAWMP